MVALALRIAGQHVIYCSFLRLSAPGKFGSILLFFFLPLPFCKDIPVNHVVPIAVHIVEWLQPDFGRSGLASYAEDSCSISKSRGSAIYGLKAIH